MAKVERHSALKRMRGSIDGPVFKDTMHGQVLTRRPDMSRVKWGSAQKARRELMQEAEHHYRTGSGASKAEHGDSPVRTSVVNPSIVYT